MLKRRCNKFPTYSVKFLGCISNMTTRGNKFPVASLTRTLSDIYNSVSYLLKRNHLCSCIQSLQAFSNPWIGEIVLGVLPHLAGVFATMLITRMHLNS